MKKTQDTSILENIAEDKISFELQKHDLYVTKPKSDYQGTDLIVFAQIEDGVKFCRVQCKGRSLEHSNKNDITIHKSYVTGGFLCFLYIYFSPNEDELYLFLPINIQQWHLNKKNEYRLCFTKKNAKKKLAKYVFDLSKASLIKTIIKDAEIRNEFSIMNYGKLEISLQSASVEINVANGSKSD